jgi:O-antigen/teichoic acid export membrane protein
MNSTSNHSAEHEHRHTIRSVSLGTFWRACRYPFVILSAILIPKFMGDTVYGEYALFMSIYVMLDVITDVGITQTFGRFIPELKIEKSNKVTQLLHSMLFYGLIMTLLVVVFGEGGLFLFGDTGYAPSLWLLLCLLLVVTKIEGTLFAFIYGNNEIARYSSKELIRSAATFILVLAGFLLFGLNGALWALLASEIALLVAALLWTRNRFVDKVEILAPRSFLSYLIFGAKFYVPMLLFTFLQRSGNLFIDQLTDSSEQIAYFDVANQYLLLTATFLGLIFTTLLPSMTTLYIRNEHDKIVEWNSKVMTYCGIVIVITVNALVLVGKDVLTLCLGSDFSSVYPNALVISLALPFVLIGYAGTNFALLEKRTHAYLTGVILGLVSMGIVCMILVPKMGAIGASWASVIGYAVLALAFIIRYFKQFRKVLIGLAKSLLIGAACVPFWFIKSNLIVSAIILILSTLVYTSLVLWFRVVSVSDIRKLVGNIKSKD